MSINPRIAPDVFIHDAKAHEGLRLGLDYMERERTTVMARNVRVPDVAIDTLSESTTPATTPHDVCAHDVREVAGRMTDGTYIRWSFAYCDHMNHLYATAPRED